MKSLKVSVKDSLNYYLTITASWFQFFYLKRYTREPKNVSTHFHRNKNKSLNDFSTTGFKTRKFMKSDCNNNEMLQRIKKWARHVLEKDNRTVML